MSSATAFSSGDIDRAASRLDAVSNDVASLLQHTSLNSRRISALTHEVSTLKGSHAGAHKKSLAVRAAIYLIRCIFCRCVQDTVAGCIHTFEHTTVLIIIGILWCVSAVWIAVGELSILISDAGYKIFVDIQPFANSVVHVVNFFAGQNNPDITLASLAANPSTRPLAQFLSIWIECPAYRSVATSIDYLARSANGVQMCVLLTRLSYIPIWYNMASPFLSWMAWQTPDCQPSIDADICFWLMFGYSLAFIVTLALIAFLIWAFWSMLRVIVVSVFAIIYLVFIFPLMMEVHAYHELSTRHKVRAILVFSEMAGISTLEAIGAGAKG